jgi:hypothetical protein
MKLSTLTIIMYGLYVFCLTLDGDNLVSSLVRTLWLHGDYEHDEAAVLLLLSPLFFYAVGHSAMRLSNGFAKWRNRRNRAD